MGGRLDTLDINFLQFLDVTENITQLIAELFFLGFGKFQPREIGDIMDVKTWVGHEREANVADGPILRRIYS